MNETPNHEPLSQALVAMVAKSDSGTIRISALIEGTQERGLLLLMILLCLPFISPIPIPGLSTVVGFAIAFMALRLAWRLPPRLPAFLARHEIPHARMQAFVGKAASVLRVIEKVVRPRFGAWLQFPAVRFFNALLLAMMGILLALPLPPVLPFSNLLPCWGIIFIALSIMERDGLLVWVGYVVAFGTCVYMAFFAGAVFVGMQKLAESLRSFLGM